MDDPRSTDQDRQLQLVRDLLEDDATIDSDVLMISTGTWAIHGTIPVDGERSLITMTPGCRPRKTRPAPSGAAG
jgi:hypothetical protein